MSAEHQLLLDIRLPVEHDFDRFLGAEPLVASLRAQIETPRQEPWYHYLWGSPGSGCTHLLQARCHLGRSLGLHCVYASCAELLGKPAAPAPAWDWLEGIGVLSLDEIDRMPPGRAAEEALFDLFNRCRGQTLLAIGGRRPPGELGLELPDLSSRLASGPVWRLPELTDEQKLVVLRDRAAQRGMLLEEDLARFMLNRLTRDMATLAAALDRLDRASLQRRRALSISLVKEVLGL